MTDISKDPLDEQRILIADCKTIFKTDAGINVLRALSKFCLENAMTFDVQSDRITSFNEGKRQVIRYIREKLAASGEPRQEKVKTE